MPPDDPTSVLHRPARAPDVVLHYGDHPEQVLDLRLPETPPRGPLLMVIHGGFWRQAYDRSHVGALSEALATAGYPVATVEYRRVGGDGGVPRTFDDVASAVDAGPRLCAAAAPGHVDPARSVLIGHSAGGHLALWASARHRLPTGSRWHRPRRVGSLAVVGLAAVCDLGSAVRDGLGRGAASDLVGGAVSGCRPGGDAGQLDPASIGGTGVPTVLVHGERDDEVPCRYSVEHVRRLQRASSPARLRLLPDAGHYELIDPSAPAWQVVLTAVADAARTGAAAAREAGPPPEGEGPAVR